MNVEDSSYEGAAERMRRLGYAGLDLTPPPETSHHSDDDDGDRMRDLEELASLACDENERLKEQLQSERGESQRLQRMVSTLQEMLACAQADEREAETAGDNQQLVEQLEVARGENQRMQRMVTMLQEMLASAQAEEPATGAEVQLVKPRSHLPYYILGVAVAGIAAVFLMLSPSSMPRVPAASTAAVQSFAAAPPPPSVAKVEPKVEPIVAKVEPIVPKVAATVPKVAATIPSVAPARAKPQRRHAVVKHAAAKSARHEGKKHAAAGKAANKLESNGDDPLSGLNL